MVTLVICFLWIYLVKGLEISVTDDLGEMYDCRKDNINYILKCSITPEALAGVVTWSKDAILLTTCSNVGDNMCVNTPGQSENRYTFTSSISQKEFLFRISSSEIGDDGTYTCEHLTVTKSFHIETCKCATQDVQNGQVTPSGAVVAGTIVTITCSDGYTIEGNQELTCQTDQTWDNPWPTCRNISITSTTTTTIGTNGATTMVASSSTYSTSTTASSTIPTTFNTTKTTATPSTSAFGTSTKGLTVTTASTVPTSSSTPFPTASVSTIKSSTDSDKGLVVMIIVVSVIGGVLVIAMLFMVFLMVHWKNHFGQTKHVHPRSHRHDKYRTDRLKHTKERMTINSLQPEYDFKGYQFYRGVKNPVFEESHANLTPPFVYYREISDLFYEHSPQKYQYANNWQILENK